MNLREWALPVYTILMQLAAGSILTLWTIRAVTSLKLGNEEIGRMSIKPTSAILCAILVAIFGAHFHLSRPFLSFLALANLGSSWLSREILFTTLFFFSVVGLAALEWLGRNRSRLTTVVGWFAAGCGVASVFCMSAIYLLPVQPIWNSPITVLTFFATTLLLGAVAMAVFLVLDLSFSEMRAPGERGLRLDVARSALVWLAVAAVVAAAVQLSLNIAQVIWLQNDNSLAGLSLELLLGIYRPLFLIRLGLSLVGVALLAAAVCSMQRKRRKVTDLLLPVYLSCLFVLVGEILGRFLFYATHIRLGI